MPGCIRIADGITRLNDATGAAILVGSHGGISSGRYSVSIEDKRMVWNDRVPSHVNDAAASAGAEPGGPTGGFRGEERSGEVSETG